MSDFSLSSTLRSSDCYWIKSTRQIRAKRLRKANSGVASSFINYEKAEEKDSIIGSTFDLFSDCLKIDGKGKTEK